MCSQPSSSSVRATGATTLRSLPCINPMCLMVLTRLAGTRRVERALLRVAAAGPASRVHEGVARLVEPCGLCLKNCMTYLYQMRIFAENGTCFQGWSIGRISPIRLIALKKAARHRARPCRAVLYFSLLKLFRQGCCICDDALNHGRIGQRADVTNLVRLRLRRSCAEYGA